MPKRRESQADERMGLGTWVKQNARGWAVYSRQEVLRAGVSLALLYLTLLSFDRCAMAAKAPREPF
jgi:hypothetical protein